MKTTKHFLTMLFFVSISLNGFSQEKTESPSIDYKAMEPKDWSIELDAVVSAGKTHKILLENDEVRVLEVTLKPGETGSLHHHRWPSVIDVLERGHFIDYDANGNVNIDTSKMPSDQKLPTTIWLDAQPPYYVKNLSGTLSIHLIRVEMKR
ncbi:cupin domain-containing protein [Aureibaculum luteum]|uniref:hypothetical protein n=1 Tax=Aureibaculum luteum TaxID=1548456 RepID=UPI000E54A762|nr:hypothetical protein [Aureibaculum luteum]